MKRASGQGFCHLIDPTAPGHELHQECVSDYCGHVQDERFGEGLRLSYNNSLRLVYVLSPTLSPSLLDHTGPNVMTEFEENIIIEASPEKVWSVLADIGTIAVWNPGVVRSEQTTPGEVSIGSGRYCDLGGKNYLNEKVISFEPPRMMTIRVTETNLPFDHADIRFFLTAQEGKTLVKVSPQYQLKFGFLGRLLDSIVVRSQYKKGMKGLLRGLKEHVEDRKTPL